MSYLWLVPVSLFCSTSSYLILRKALVPWLSKKTLLRKDAQASVDTREVLVLNLSVWIMTWVMGVATSVVSVIVLLETMHDSLFARSTVLIPWVHFAAWYYLIDTYATFEAFVRKRNLMHRRMKTQFIIFAKKKWSNLLHHFLLFFVGYPVMVNDSIRGYKGDFYSGALLAMDISNPLLVNAKILKNLGMTGNTFYTINGILLVIIFLLVRVLNIPICILIYTAQYHQWRVVDALGRLRWSCYAGGLALIFMQSYWFIAIVKIAKTQLQGKTNQNRL